VAGVVSWLKRLRGGGAKPPPIEPDPGFMLLLADHGLVAFERQLAFAEVVGERDWQLDQDAGILQLGDDLALSAQILGSAADESGTWLWAWANPSVDASLTQAAWRTREIGDQRGIAALTEPEVPLARVIDDHTLVLAIAGALDADAYYRCPYPGGAAFVTVEVAGTRGNDRVDPATRAVEVINAALMAFPHILGRRAVDRYIETIGAPYARDGAMISIGGKATLRFDELDRLTGFQTTLGPSA
jgi:hypothetical protein